METAKLKKFAQFARRSLMEQVSAKLRLVLAENSAARRENPKAVAEIEKAISNQPSVISKGKEPTDGCRLTADGLIERVAYIWFNRFCALRFMDVNRYNFINIVSPADPGQFQPEILAEAKMGHIDEEMAPEKTRQQIFALLDGKAPSRDPQGEAYRLLVVAACNFFHRAMPFLFQRIDDYTELLMPDDLLSENSILAHMREAICLPTTEGVRGQGLGASENPTKPSSLIPNPSSTSLKVEVIGWLYQFYISEKKDEVFDGLKKNKKITPDNIPAATQLFTPHWIVKYLVENSLGRLWMLNRPNSRLIDKMEYYIRPDTSGVRDQGLGVSEKTGGNHGSEKLSGSDCLAKGDGHGGNSLSGDEGLSQGRALRIDESGAKSSGFNPVQHSGGTRSQLDSGVQELPFDSTGLQSGSGNANPDSSKAALHISAASSGNTLSSQRDQQNVSRSEEQANPWPLTPNPSASTREEDFLRIEKPEDIKICDPACGSGHMLTYAFDLLYAIYEEEGYEPAEIPEKILTNNLYGIEIDERAGELAAFALTMKARAKQRRFFNKGVKPNICVLENVHFDEGELKNYMDFVGRDLFTAPLQTTLRQFEEANNFGSLIRPELTDVAWVRKTLNDKNVSGQLFLSLTHQKVLKALRQADYLSPKYHVVIANPPYMGGKGMNGRLGAWAKENYPNSKSDLFAMFMERNLDLAKEHGAVAMITMQSWMFLTYFEKLRSALLGSCSITSMCHLGPHAFDSIGGEVVQTTAFVMENIPNKIGKGLFLRLVDGSSEAEKKRLFSERKWKPFKSSTAQFMSVAGNPIIYWVSDQVLKILETRPPLRTLASIKSGLSTGDNEKFVKIWSEVNFNDIEFNIDANEVCNKNSYSWTPYNKGGESRRWFGNNVNVVFWKDNGAYLKKTGVFRNPSFYFREGITWSGMSSKNIPFRFVKGGFIFDSNKGPMVFQENSEINNMVLLGLLNTPLTTYILDALNPTVSTQVGDLERIPVSIPTSSNLTDQISNCISISRTDWDSYETSWDFTILPTLNPDYRQSSLKATYQKLRAHWREMTLEMQRLEEENNRIFIDAYGLQDELTPDVPLKEITLTCNPHYRYGNDKREDELEALLLADTMRELVSYAVGCMFGRYSLDAPGLILANQGECIDDYWRSIEDKRKHPDSHQPSVISNQQRAHDAFTEGCKLTAEGSSSGFQPDEDNVIPMLDGDWFTDDIAERFRKFLRVAFGDEYYEANLKFVEKALGKNGKARDIRDYFLKDFYTDHVKRYKKRPIYWLFSSPKGSFNALIYMHRYRPDTVSVVLNDYLREFRTKLTSHKNHLEAVSISASSSQGEKTKALKEIEKVKKMIAEMEEYEREVLYPLATEQVEIDLDDGVKVNYPKLGTALKKIPGLETAEE